MGKETAQLAVDEESEIRECGGIWYHVCEDVVHVDRSSVERDAHAGIERAAWCGAICRIVPCLIESVIHLYLASSGCGKDVAPYALRPLPPPGVREVYRLLTCGAISELVVDGTVDKSHSRCGGRCKGKCKEDGESIWDS